MGAAASVDFRLPDENFPQNLELQAAANWHRIIKHANNGGSADNESRQGSDSIAFVSRGRQRLFDVYLPGSLSPHQPPTDGGAEAAVFKTGQRVQSAESCEPTLKASSELYRASERVPVDMRLARRSGNTLVLEWDGGAAAEAITADLADRRAAVSAERVRYEVIAGVGQDAQVQWHLILAGAAGARSAAVRCPQCNTVYRFRCRRVIPALPPPGEAKEEAEEENVAWLPGAWGPEVI